MTTTKIDFAPAVEAGWPMCRRGEGFADNLSSPERGRLAGRAVPYGHTIELMDGVYERFEKGAFAKQTKDPARVKICFEHGQVIGKATALEERDDGLWFDSEISSNPAILEATRAMALVDEDLVDELSIGFATVKGGTRVERLENGRTMYTHNRARLLEVSLVPWGAYGRGATLQRSRFVAEADPKELARAAAREWVRSFRERA